MSKQKFIKEVELFKDKLSPEALKFFEDFKDKTPTGLTELNIEILSYMRENESKFGNCFTSKLIGEGVNTAPKRVSGSLRKLLNLCLIEKNGSAPVQYGLTADGRAYRIDKN